MAAQEHFRRAARPHGMAARRPRADLIKFFDGFHRLRIISFLSPLVAHTLANRCTTILINVNCLTDFSRPSHYSSNAMSCPRHHPAGAGVKECSHATEAHRICGGCRCLLWPGGDPSQGHALYLGWFQKKGSAVVCSRNKGSHRPEAVSLREDDMVVMFEIIGEVAGTDQA
jgi:hypothetical protein